MLKTKQALSRPAVFVPLVLLALCGFSYAPLIPSLSFYWDDLPITWIYSAMGTEGLARYFSTNRPAWGLLFRATLPLLGAVPWHWEVFALLWRWISGWLFWAVIRLAWPRQPRLALYAAMLFVVFPVLPVQFIAVMFSHFFIVFSAFLASLSCGLLAQKTGGWKFRLLTAAGVLLSLVNLLTLEYFLPLEALRPLLFYMAFRNRTDETPAAPARAARLAAFKSGLAAWLPYLLALAGAMAWRMFFFRFQTQNYEYVLLNDLKTAPLPALLQLARTVVTDLWTVTLATWGRAFTLPDVSTAGRFTTLAWAVLTLAASGSTFLALRWWIHDDEQPDPKQGIRSLSGVLLTALAALLLAGLPFWMVRLAVNLQFPNSRGIISFVPGVCLLLAGLLSLPCMPRNLRLGLAALLVGFGVGNQFQQASLFRRDTSLQGNLLWHLAWRAPALAPDTALLINDVPLHFSTDNSMTAAVNWLYGEENTGGKMPYVLYYPSLRQGSGLPGLDTGLPIHQDYLAAEFNGSTSQALVVYYAPPSCLRLLDPDLDAVNAMVPASIRSAAVLSNGAVVQSDSPAHTPRPDVFGREPARGWCYYYEKAALAAEKHDWAGAASMADVSLALGDTPSDPSERVPFIEGYAHSGRWQDALGQSRAAQVITPLMQPVLCRLWQRIGREAAPSTQKEQAVREALEGLECGE